MCEKPCKNYFTHLQCSQLWEITCSWAKIALPCGCLWHLTAFYRPVWVLGPHFKLHMKSVKICILISHCVCCFVTQAFQSSVVSDSLWPCGPKHASLPCPSSTPGPCSNLMSIESVVPSNHLILCHPLLFLPSVFPRITVFSNESVHHMRWKKYRIFSFQHQSFQWIFRTDFI